MSDADTVTDNVNGNDNNEDLADEWQAVPTTSHPEPDITGRYPCAPGPADGLTEGRAREIVIGRNREGEPSPSVRWHPEPTGRRLPREELQEAIDPEFGRDR